VANRVTRDTRSDHGGSDAAASFTVLGVDPGLIRTGYAVIAFPDRIVRDAGIVCSTEKHPLADRLREIDEGIEDVLADHAIDLVAVEDLYAHYKHPRTAILMGHARGVIFLAAAKRGIEVVSVSSTAVKKSLTGNGHAGKSQMQRAIATTLRLSRCPEPADVADALAVALCAAIGRNDSKHRTGVMT